MRRRPDAQTADTARVRTNARAPQAESGARGQDPPKPHAPLAGARAPQPDEAFRQPDTKLGWMRSREAGPGRTEPAARGRPKKVS